MKRRSEPPEDVEALRAKIIGLGERSVRKSYYPELQQQYAELRRFRQLLDQSSELILIFDVLNLQVVDANDTVCQMLKRTRENLLGTSLVELHPQLSETAWEAAASPNRSIPLRFRYVCVSGIMRILDGWAKVVAVDDQLTGMLIARDISDRVRAEEALRESELKYRRLHESMRDAFVSVDMGGYLQEFNSAYQAMLGYSAEELRCLAYPDLTPERWHGFEAEIVEKQILGRGYSDVYEKEYRRKDGSVFPVELRTFLLRDAAEQPIGMWAIVRDITERKRIELALRENSVFLNTLLNAIPLPVLYKDAGGCYLGFNEAFAEFYGKEQQELIGKNVFDLNPKELAKIHHAKDRELIAHSGSQVYESQLVDARNIVHDVIFHKAAFTDSKNQVLGLIGVVLDITERKRAEAELRRHREHLEELVAERTAELRQAMSQLMQAEKLAALGQLVAGVAHELNTPLGNARVVASSLGEALREFAAAVESGSLRRSQVEAFLERGREAVDMLERNTARAADLIGHFKQVAVDQTSVRRRRFSLRQVVEELLVTLQPQFKRTAHRVELDISPELELDSYPGPLEQVIVNLVANSLAHGFTEIAAGTIQIIAAPLDASYIQLRYGDNGAGIPNTVLDRIFEPFFTTRLGSGGSGLGLYIVYNLVTGILGGSIKAHSEKGRGVRFSLSLPRIAPSQATLGIPSASLAPDAPDGNAQ